MDNSLVANHPSLERFDQFCSKQSHSSLKRAKPTPALTVPTNILLEQHNGISSIASSCKNGVQERLHLPSAFFVSPCILIDKHLRLVPQLWNSAQNLFRKPTRFFSSTSPERLLYVGQGEVAHAVASQCDVVASDRATTCHILALRSTVKDDMKSEPLVSMAHVDWTGYHECIEGMIQHHKRRHLGKDCSSGIIEMDIHIVGGFEDGQGSSRELSNFLMDTLTQVATEERDYIRMTLKTCAITCMNDTGYNQPIARGLGINVSTGEVSLAKVDRTVVGPCQELRSARLWAGANDQLFMIHSSLSDCIVIRPFYFRPRPRFGKLLRLADHQLLPKTSTSPTLEEDDFCDNVRKTFQFLLKVKCSDVFGRGYDSPVVFSRKDNSNTWELAMYNKEGPIAVVG